MNFRLGIHTEYEYDVHGWPQSWRLFNLPLAGAGAYCEGRNTGRTAC